MAINRRNVLLGLGAIVGGGGALVGTGAFSTVSAARSVTAHTAGDGSAYLQITSSNGYVTDADDTDELNISLTADGNSTAASGFNDEAMTTIKDVVTITNNAAPDGSGGPNVNVGLQTSGPTSGQPPSSAPSGATTVLVSDGSGTDPEEVAVTFYMSTAYSTDTDGDTASYVGNDQSPVQLAPGDSVDVDVEIDTTGETLMDGNDQQLTIVAVSV